MSSSKALEFFNSGICCSEAVVKGAMSELNMDNADFMADVASAFCGGMGAKSVCGALTACGIVIGAKCGKAGDAARSTAAVMGGVVEGFKAKHGSINCNELTAKFLSDAASKKEFCGSLVVDAVERVVKAVK